MTNLRKLILMALLALPLSLAVGCGDDDPNGEDPTDPTDPGNGNGGGGTKVDPEKHCRDGAEAWDLTALLIESDGDAPYGFNLDDHVTTSADTEKTPSAGCGVDDKNAQGIDNAFAELLGLVGALGEDVDINEIIAGALAGGDIKVIAYIRGYEAGGANDDIELTLIINDTEYESLVDVPAKLEDGKIVATLDRLPLTLSGINLDIGDEPVELNLTVNILDVRVEISEPGTDTTSVAILGGGVQVGGEGGLQADIEKLIDELGFGELIEEFGGVEGLMGMFADLSSNGTDCDSLSLGAEVTFTYNDDLCN